MSNVITSLSLVLVLASFAQAEEPVELQRIHDLDVALQQGGVSGLFTTVQQHPWPAPRMPSKWSVENRPNPTDKRKVDLSGREFGRKLAVQMEAVAPSLQEMSPGFDLNRQAHLLCDLSDWCASTSGYGNLFLAQRCLDLAAVGLARLTASMDFPLTECERLAARMTPAWMDVATRARTLNDEAGTNIFAVGGTQAEMEKTWGSGGFLMREKRAGIARPQGKEPGRGFVETAALEANLAFFEDDAEPRAVPLTLVRSWNSKRYERIVNGLELQNVNKALALLKFRSVVGRFPEKPQFTTEQLQRQEEEITAYAKMGIKASRMYEGMPSGKAAFGQAWDDRKDKNPQDHNLDAPAWQAYNEVKTSHFLDQDTREERKAAQMRSTPEPKAQ